MIGSFTIIKNEANWIAGHLASWLPVLDEMVFFDGNSTDGTVEIIEAVRSFDANGHKIRLFKDKDPRNLEDDYVRVFNECLRSVQSDYAAFIHPDMILESGDASKINASSAVALTMGMRSFGGEPGGDLHEIHGRAPVWKNIYRLRNPDLGCHYWGHYGAAEEDCYFSSITGAEHRLSYNFEDYPYEIEDSGLKVLHFSDVRNFGRRLGRMKECLKNQGRPAASIDEIAKSHPRVILKDGSGLAFTPAQYPPAFLAAQSQYKHLVKEPAIV